MKSWRIVLALLSIIATVILLFCLAAGVRWAHANIFEQRTFWFVVAIGVAQTVVSIESGYLAIRALPPKLPRLNKSLHGLFFGLLGFVLLASIVIVGVFNDRSQHHSAEQVEEIKGQLAISQAALDRANGGVNRANGALDLLTKVPTGNMLVDAPLRRAIQKIQADLTQAIIPPHANGPVPNMGFTPIPLSPTSPEPTADHLSDLQKQILMLITSLHNEGESVQDGNSRALHDLNAALARHPPDLVDSTRLYQQIVRSNADRDEFYTKLLPQIESLRAEMHVLTKMSAAEITEDNLKFDARNKVAITPTPSPMNSAGLPSQNIRASISPKFLGIQQYLYGVDHQLSTLPNYPHDGLPSF